MYQLNGKVGKWSYFKCRKVNVVFVYGSCRGRNWKKSM